MRLVSDRLKLGSCLIAIGVSLIACSAVELQSINLSSSRPISARLILDTLHCGQTTDPEGDQVYVMVIGKTSTGAEFWTRFPEEGHYWAMHAHDVKSDIRKIELWQGSLHEEDSVDMTVLLMEKDQGPPNEWLTILMDIQSKIDPKRSTVGSTHDLEKALAHPTKDVDDLLGAFHIRLKPKAGRLTAVWRWGVRTDGQEKVMSTLEEGTPLYGHEFETIGGGGLYRALVTTQPSYR